MIPGTPVTTQPHEPEIEVQDLLWLLDAPLFIDDKQVNNFYNAVVRPDIVDPASEGASVQYRPKSIKIDTSKEKEIKIATKFGGKFKAGLGLPGLLQTIFPSIEIEGTAERGKDAGEKDSTSKSVELMPVENPQRQLVHLGVHYFVNVTERLFLVKNPSEEEWRNPESILKSPRALAFLDLPPTIIIPTAAEFENNTIDLLYKKFITKLGVESPVYPEYPVVAFENLLEERKKYWKWFQENFSGSKAMQVIEEAATNNGKIRWIDYRMPLNDEGDTLHLHVCPNGKYDTGVLAYNFIKRGQKHGLRLVGTLKSEPDMNVLAVYEK